MRILILDNHDDGAALAEYLATFPGIEAIAVEDSLHHGWGEIQEGHPDVIIVDPFYEEIRESDGFANYDRLEPNRLVYRFNKTCTDYSAPSVSNFFHR